MNADLKGRGRILGWNQVSVSFLIYEILFVMDKVSNILTKSEYLCGYSSIVVLTSTCYKTTRNKNIYLFNVVCITTNPTFFATYVTWLCSVTTSVCRMYTIIPRFELTLVNVLCIMSYT